MQRSTLKSSLLSLVALGLLAGPALAQAKMDCGRLYKDLWEKLDLRNGVECRHDRGCCILGV